VVIRDQMTDLLEVRQKSAQEARWRIPSGRESRRQAASDSVPGGTKQPA